MFTLRADFFGTLGQKLRCMKKGLLGKKVAPPKPLLHADRLAQITVDAEFRLKVQLLSGFGFGKG